MTTHLETARQYCKAGFSPIPVPRRKKGPASKNWQNTRINASNVNAHFGTTPTNIELLVGEASNNYVDVDLDALESITAAEFFLPPTPMVFGHQSKPRSHRGYRTPDLPGTIKFCDVPGPNGSKGAVLLECHTGIKKTENDDHSRGRSSSVYHNASASRGPTPMCMAVLQ